MTNQEIFDTLDSAFSEFMVADMNHRRCETYMCQEEEALYYATRDGDRTGRIVASVYDDHDRLFNAIHVWLIHLKHPEAGNEPAMDRCEEQEVPMKSFLTYLCCKYQHDEHRKHICKAYAEACLKSMVDTLTQKKEGAK